MKKILTLSFLSILASGALSSCVYNGPYGYSYAPSYWSLWGGYHNGPHGAPNHHAAPAHHNTPTHHAGGGHMGGGGHHGGGGHR